MKRTAIGWIGTLVFLMAVAACKNNPDITVNNPTATGPGGPGTSAAVATITVVPSAPAPVIIGNTIQFTATALDATGTPVTGVSFTWVSSSPAVASISSTGLVTGLTAGTTDITATSGTITNIPAVTLTVTCAGIPASISTPIATPNPVSTFGQSSIQVNVTDCTGSPVPDGTQVAFSVSPTKIGTITGTSTNPATTTGGLATATFTAANVFGTATITATVGSLTSNPVLVPVTAPAAGSIQFLSATPTVIGVKGSGQIETSTILFQVSDVNGNPVVDGSQVIFEMTGPNCTSTQSPPSAATSDCPNPAGDSNDEYINPVLGSTVNGVATTILNSGKVAGPVLIKATVASNLALATAATGVSIGGGVPSASHFHISASRINIAGDTDIGGYDDQTTTLTAYLADRFGNSNVLSGTSVSFYTEAGHLTSSKTTTICKVPGACTMAELDAQGVTSVGLTSQGTVPINVYPWLNMTATSSSADITLSWDSPWIYWTRYSPSTPVGFDVYRNTVFEGIPIDAYDPSNTVGSAMLTTTWKLIAKNVLLGSQTAIGGVICAATANGGSCTDSSVVLDTTYFYFVVARDANGRVADSPVLSATRRAFGGITSGTTINEPSYADIFPTQNLISVMPDPITTPIRNPRDGWVTVLAVTQGEEAFTDLNGNGVYDVGEPFIDTNGEPFLDANDNGVYDPPETFLDLNQNGIYDMGEPFVDSNGNGVYDPGDPFFIDVNHNGVWDGPNGVWDSSTLIWEKIKLVFSGAMAFDSYDGDDPSQTNCLGIYAPFNCAPQSTSRIEIDSKHQDSKNADFFLIQNGDCAFFTVFISDANLNRMIPGTTISIKNTGGKLNGPTSLSIPDGLSTGPYIFGISLCDDDSTKIKTDGASIEVDVTWSPPNHDIIVYSMSLNGTVDFIPTPDHVIVTPSAPSVAIAATVQLTATAYDASNVVIPGVTFTWSSSNPAVATVDPTGLVTGIASGSATISATSTPGNISSNTPPGNSAIVTVP
ncbi:MAG: Ig-like domain-containing protein [Nitrospirae bacterium]|nr:Ig-like domain-containing protein [Nitrospirota bacterium]